MKRIIICCLVMLMGTVASADDVKLNLTWELVGLKNPESVIYDSKRDRLYVSNVNGGAVDKDGNGFISIVSMDGKLVDLMWVEGMNAPKGLAIHQDKLYTADIDELIVIDIEQAKIIQRHKVADAKFLNDVAATSNGDVYVSDMAKDRIHQLSQDVFSIWLESPDLEAPNGLLVWGEDLMLASWGAMDETMATKVAGHLKRINLKDKTISSVGDGSPVGNLDGIEGDNDGDFYVTDWVNGKLLHIERSGEVEILLELNQGSADHEVVMNKKLLLVPMMLDNTLRAYSMEFQGH